MLQMCELFEISRSSYYAWSNRDLDKDFKLKEEIKNIFIERRETYGSRRIHAELISRGIEIGHNKVSRLKRDLDLYPKMRRKYKITTDSKHTNKISDNLLNRNFSSEVIMEKVVSDITYVSTLEGWLYLSTLIDLSTRKVVSYKISDVMDVSIVKDAIENGFKVVKIPDGAIFHSDRGSQYSSNDVRNLLKDLGVNQSMSRKGNCWDMVTERSRSNAVAESFFKTLKYDGDIKRVFKTKKEAKLAIFEFIEVFYNNKRRHSSLNYLTPNEAEKYLINRNKMVA